MKKSLYLLVLAFTLFFTCNVFATTSTNAVYSGKNVENQNYTVWSKTVKSYLIETEDGQLMRFQADALSTKYLVEYYDKEYNYLSTVKVDQELTLFGGFYDDGVYYYVLSGQKNPDESDAVEVYRLTRYDHSWNRLDSTGLNGANTCTPFANGSARMTHEGSNLFIRTCHEMYKTKDGYHHQANVTIQINTDTMQVVDSYYKIMNVSYGYVSHSFNQFIKLDNGHIVGVDHGDALPRSVVLCRYKETYTDAGFDKSCTAVDMRKISGVEGDNSTGVSVGGFQVSSTSYLVAGNSVKMGSNYSANKIRNIFVSVVDRKLKTDPKVIWITSYDSESLYKPTTPQLVDCGDDTFLLMWTYQGNVNYCKLDCNGNKITSIYKLQGNLSDCEPLVVDGKVVWYVWEEALVTFNSINLSQIKITESDSLVGKTKDIDSATITLNYTRTTYTGNAKRPGVTVIWNGRTLTKNENYAVIYSDNVEAGTGKVKITGIGDFTGSTTRTFTIKKAYNTITVSNVTRPARTTRQRFTLKVKVKEYAKLSYSTTSKYVTINSKGRVTIPERYRGTCYIKVKASYTRNYRTTTKKVKLVVK